MSYMSARGRRPQSSVCDMDSCQRGGDICPEFCQGKALPRLEMVVAGPGKACM